MAFSWTCPHCSMLQAVTKDRHNTGIFPLGLSEQAEGKLGMSYSTIGCSNDVCKKTTVHSVIGAVHVTLNGHWEMVDEHIFDQRLIPQGTSRPQPEFIPLAVREDYYEACLIRDLSPKASATLTRRCVQGMIRDFCGISRGRLIDEIKELKRQVSTGEADRSISSESVEAIDHVRTLGNIGAHMEADINVILSVDPGEAQAMIDLAELLFDEWYVERFKRQQRLAKVNEITVTKALQKAEMKKLPAAENG